MLKLQFQAYGEVDLALTEACAGLAEHNDVTVPALYTRLRGQTLFHHPIQAIYQEKIMSADLAKKEKQQNKTQIGGVNIEGVSGSSISIGGDLSADVSAGGHIVGGDYVETHGGSASSEPTPEQVLREALTTWKEEVATLLDQSPDINEYARQDISDKVEQFEAEVQKGAEAEVGRAEYMMNSLRNMAPDILEVTFKTLQNPVAGIGLVMEKINDRIKLERESE